MVCLMLVTEMSSHLITVSCLLLLVVLGAISLQLGLQLNRVATIDNNTQQLQCIFVRDS